VRVPVSLDDSKEAVATFVTFDHLHDHKEHIAILFDPYKGSATPTVRIHSECLTGDVFHSLRCDCRQQLTEALEMLSGQGGILLYMRHEGRGIGLYNKLDAYHLQIEKGLDTFSANKELGYEGDLRSYEEASQMLAALGIKKVKLLTNNPAKVNGLQQYGIEVSEMIPTRLGETKHNRSYLLSKKRSGHNLNISDDLSA